MFSRKERIRSFADPPRAKPLKRACFAGARRTTWPTALITAAAGAVTTPQCLPGTGLHWPQRRMREMTVYGVSFDMVGRQPIVLLKTADGSQFLPIWIGHAEAAAILMKLQGSTPVRPLTHDLLTSVIGQLEAEVVRITVTELRDSTFYASITLRQDGQELEIDSRPSDAIALAVRVEAKIFATDEVIEESAIEFEGDDEENERRIARVSGLADLDPEEFRQFLDSVTAEDFAQAEGEDEPEARD
jgi:uncharacterized protein